MSWLSGRGQTGSEGALISDRSLVFIFARCWRTWEEAGEKEDRLKSEWSRPVWDLYMPNKTADKVGLTRSPLTELFGLWRSRGPASPMMSAPTGAVRRMASTATVSTSMPYFCSCRSFLFRAMSKAVEPIAAWKRPEKRASPQNPLKKVR